jgi:hypothetical protein
VSKLKLPGFGDRVVLAAGEDAHTGSHKLDELLDRIAEGREPLLTRQETGSLRDVLVGKFRRKPGQSEKREYSGLLTQTAVALYHQMRAKDKSRSEDETINAVRAEMGDVCAPSFSKIKNELHRWREWGAKRRQNKKLK